jgi:hypothetical protein
MISVHICRDISNLIISLIKKEELEVIVIGLIIKKERITNGSYFCR